MFPHSPPYSQWVAPFRIFVYVLLFFCGFSVHFRSSWLAWAPLWTHPAPDLLKCRKLSEKLPKMSGVLIPLATLGAAMGPIGEPLCPTCAQSLLQIEIWSISENVCVPLCFQWFLRVGGASKAPKGRLEGPLGGTLGPKVTTWTHIFAIRIQVRFLSVTWERQMR